MTEWGFGHEKCYGMTQPMQISAVCFSHVLSDMEPKLSILCLHSPLNTFLMLHKGKSPDEVIPGQLPMKTISSSIFSQSPIKVSASNVTASWFWVFQVPKTVRNPTYMLLFRTFSLEMATARFLVLFVQTSEMLHCFQSAHRMALYSHFSLHFLTLYSCLQLNVFNWMPSGWMLNPLFYYYFFLEQFFNDLPRGRARAKIFMYADETVPLVAVNDVCFHF